MIDYVDKAVAPAAQKPAAGQPPAQQQTSGRPPMAAAPAQPPVGKPAGKPAPVAGDGVVAPNPTVADAPPPRPGALNPAYTTTATNDDIHNEVGQIKGRIEMRTGLPATATPVLQTFERNLERKVRASIIALAVKKYGKVPTKPAVDATYAAWATRWLAKFLEAAQRELRAHNHPAHAAGLAHEKHLAQMHVDQIGRAQEQRTGVNEQRVATTDRRQQTFKVKYNRRESGGDDRRQGDRRAAPPAEKAEVIVEHDWIGKYDESEARDPHGEWSSDGGGDAASIRPVLVRNGWQKHLVEGDSKYLASIAHDHATLTAYFQRNGFGRRSEEFAREIEDAVRPKKVATVADLVKGKIKYKGNLTNIVYRYLLRSYPDKDVEWVNDKGGEWEYDPHVKLSDINMARRPGGRDPDKVKAISKTLGDGASLDPIVLVDDGNPAGYEIADGWHRTLGAEDAGLDDVPAFIGTGFGKNLGLSAPWGTEMQDASDSKKRAEFAELAVLRRFMRKGGLPENFRTSVIRPDVMEKIVEDAYTPEGSLEDIFERARMRLEGVVLKGADDEPRDDHGKWVRGGGTFKRDDVPTGKQPYAIVVDHGPAGGASLEQTVIRVGRHKDDSGRGTVDQALTNLEADTGHRIQGWRVWADDRPTRKADDIEKDFSLSAPLSTGFAPFGLDQEPSPGDTPAPTCKTCDRTLVDGVCPEHGAQKMNPNHDEQGRFATGDGSGSGGDPAKIVDALAAGQSPTCEPEQVRAILEAAAKRTDDPDLTELKVNGTKMFGADGLGIARADMPQIPAGSRDAFLQSFKDKGIGVTSEQVDPQDLHPIQKEISARAVGGMLDWWRGGGGQPSIVSNDNYIVDGHHGWGAATALSFEQPDFKMPIERVDLGHDALMSAAESFDASAGIAHRALGKIRRADLELLAAIDAELARRGVDLAKFNPYHDDGGRFATGDGGPSAATIVASVRQGGATIANAGASPTSGFVVALAGHSGIVPEDDFLKGDGKAGLAEFKAWASQNRDSIAKAGYVGVWHDQAHGEVVFDPVEVMDNKDAAVAAGTDRNQQAIWDVTNQTEIPTGGTGDRPAES